MKELHELNLPENLLYTKEHEWAKKEGDIVVIGISDYAQDQLGDIVFVETPGVGDTFEQGDEFGTLESVKAVSELYIPIGGEVTDCNDALEDSPELINQDPYANWIIKIKPEDEVQLEALMNSTEYLKILEGE